MDYLRRIQGDDDPRAEMLRAAGGVLIGLAAAAIAVRKSGAVGEAWGDVALLLVFAIPALILFGGGLLAVQSAALPRPWHAVWLILGVVFVYLSMLQLIEVVEGDPGAPLNVAWTWAVVAVASLIAAREAFVRFGFLAAGIAAGIAFLALCDELLPDGIGEELATFRNVCMVVTVGLLVAAFLSYRAGEADDEEAAELLTAAGVFFVVGTALAGFVSVSFGFALSAAPAAAPIDRGAVPEPSLFWDVVLGVGALALVVAGNMLEKRGPIYVGAAGLTVFALIVGSDLDNPDRDGSLVGWPLVLTIGAIVAIGASAVGLTGNTAAPVETHPEPEGTPWNS